MEKQTYTHTNNPVHIYTGDPVLGCSTHMLFYSNVHSPHIYVGTIFELCTFERNHVDAGELF